jgi:carbon monoxide dehydrogenase subunit G
VARSTSVIDYRGRFTFDVPREAMWSSLEHCERFEAWWSWLREFRLEGPGLVAGAVLHGVVSPPVPYTMRIQVVLDHCIRPSRIDATVHGDLEGEACLVLEPSGQGTVAEASWTVEMKQRPMRLAARVAHPLMRWGHDRVIEATVNGFRRNLGREIERSKQMGENEGS